MGMYIDDWILQLSRSKKVIKQLNFKIFLRYFFHE